MRKILLGILGLVGISFATEYFVYSPKETGYKGEEATYGGYVIAKTNDYDAALFIAEEVESRTKNRIYVVEGGYDALYKAFKKSCIKNFIYRKYSDYPKLDDERVRLDLKAALEYYKNVKIPASCELNKLEDFMKILGGNDVENQIRDNLKEYFEYVEKEVKS
jgi:hypothetical protein